MRQRHWDSAKKEDLIEGNPQIKISLPDPLPHDQATTSQIRGVIDSQPVARGMVQFEESYDQPSSLGYDVDSEYSTSGFATPADGYVLPETITYTLHVTFEGDTVPNKHNNELIHPNNSSSYELIAKASEDCIRTQCDQTALAGKSVNFRQGTCTITFKESSIGKHTQGLSTAADWKDICTVLVNLWKPSMHHSIHLDIYREYFGLLTRSFSDESFAKAKRNELWKLMKSTFNGRKYIPLSDLKRVASMDMIRGIIIDDATIVPAEKEDLIQEVYDKAPILLTMCVFARLRMKCLKALLCSRVDDETYPLEERHCCHDECEPDFHNLLEYQGRFHTARFFKPGEHKKLPIATVVPINFHPRDRDTTTFVDGPQQMISEDAVSYKQRAHCGSGAFSNVYRVRIDPCHHRLAKVSQENIHVLPAAPICFISQLKTFGASGSP